MCVITPSRWLAILDNSVLSAPDGASALRLLDSHHEVSLLFTDVGLPGGMHRAPTAGTSRGGLRDPSRRRRTTLRRAGCYRLVRVGRSVRSTRRAAAVAGVISLARADRAADRWRPRSIFEPSHFCGHKRRHSMASERTDSSIVFPGRFGNGKIVTSAVLQSNPRHIAGRELEPQSG